MTNYTPEHYEQDKRIAHHIFKRYFKGHYLKEDLIQVAIYELWRLRKQNNSLDYFSNACNTAHRKMISYLRKETRHTLADSLDRFVSESVGLRLSDITPIEQPTAQEWNDYIELMWKILPPSLPTQERKIISLHLKHYTQRIIAKRVGISQPYVNRVIKNFRDIARQVLDGGAE